MQLLLSPALQGNLLKETYQIAYIQPNTLYTKVLICLKIAIAFLGIFFPKEKEWLKGQVRQKPLVYKVNKKILRLGWLKKNKLHCNVDIQSKDNTLCQNLNINVLRAEPSLNKTECLTPIKNKCLQQKFGILSGLFKQM